MALSAAQIFEVRAAGSDNNGGGYKGGGTDFSQQNSPALVIDGVLVATSITGSTVTFTGGYLSSAGDVGNTVNWLTGTNVIAGVYEITAQTSSTWTLDRTPLSSGTTTNATGNMGGAFATPGKAAAVAQVSNNLIYCKGAFTLSGAGITLAAGVTLIGYSASRTDGVQSAWDASGMTAASNTLTFGVPSQVRNVAITGSRAIAFVGNATSFGYNLTSTGSLSHGFSSGLWEYCWAATPAGNGFNGVLCASDCLASGATSGGNGFSIASGGMISECVAYGNAGRGITGANLSYAAKNCVAYGNTGVGIVAPTSNPFLWVNLISYGNTGAGYQYNSSGALAHGLTRSCFAGSNTGGAVANGPNATLDDAITNLTADPFANAAGLDFTLNATAGGGALARNAGFATILGLVAAGSSDAGALRHADVRTLGMDYLGA